MDLETNLGDIPFYQCWIATIMLWVSRVLSWEWDAEKELTSGPNSLTSK